MGRGAVSSPVLRLAGASLVEAAAVANAAAGVVVGKIGTAAADREALQVRFADAVAAFRESR
jgi:bifunctional ADP-heptose synthase (sugar kinase/adenylyltransferase)